MAGSEAGDAEAILMRLPGKSLPRFVRSRAQEGFKPVPLGVKASLGVRQRDPPPAKHNVIGILPGKTGAE
jgi:hypothetical protein